MTTPARTLLTVAQMAARHPGLTPAGIRWQIFRAGASGLEESGAILRMGRRVLIDEDRWLAWLDQANGVRTPGAA